MQLNDEIIAFINSQLPILKAEKAELEGKLKDLSDDIFALEHLLERAKPIINNTETGGF